jgi:transposase
VVDGRQISDSAVMALSIDELPNDVESLKALLLAAHAASQAAEAKSASLTAEVERLTARAERLDHIVSVLRRAQFGRRSERISEDQIELALEDVETQHGTEDASAEKSRDSIRCEATKARRANRGHLPAHLPRAEIVIEPEAKACPCCGGALHVIGEDVSERLDKVPARLRVIVTRRPKYACRSCTDGVVQAPAPHRLIEGGLPTETLIADVLVSKYADHLPLYRQAQILAREGVRIDRSTLAHWVGFAAFELAPLHDRLVSLLKASTKLFADETRCPVLDPGRGRTKTGYLWAIARDEAMRAWTDKQLERVPGRSPIAEAMRYGTSHWQGLCRFLDDGRVEIHTNVVERAIRPIALNRKNALFAGSDEGGANWAIIASLIETAKLNGVNPHAWLADTLTKLVNRWPASRIDELMPWAYAKTAIAA